jgi:hypothetical protein
VQNVSFVVVQKEKRKKLVRLLFQCMAQGKSIFLQIAIEGAKEAYVLYISNNWFLCLLVVYFLPFKVRGKN